MNRKGFSVNMFNYRMALSVILAAVLFLPSFVRADAISDVAYDQQNPHTIYLIDQGTSGVWLTVWEDWRNRATTGADIYGQFIKPNGTFCGPEFVITKAPGNQTVPRAAYRQDLIDPAKSKAVVVWQDTRPNYVYVNALSNIDVPAGCSFDTATEKAIGYNPVRVYSYGSQSSVPVVNESLGTGNGTTTTFSAFLNQKPVVWSTVEVKVGTAVVAVDDGFGTIGTSDGPVKGTINYNSGAINVTFETAPANGANVRVSYYYFSSIVSVTDEPFSYGNGVDTDFRGTLFYAPVLPPSSGPPVVPALFIEVNGVATGTHDDGLGRLIPTIQATNELIATGDDVTKTFTQILAHHPVEKGKVVVKVGGVKQCDDSGFISGCTVLVNYDTGFVTASFMTPPAALPVTVNYKYYAGTVSYETGAVSLSFATPPVSGDSITINYSYQAFPPAKVSDNDTLLARAQPRIAYDRTADRFWVVWKETRSILHQLSELCFAARVGAITEWSFDDSDFIGYVRLEGAGLFEQRSALEVGGADIVRNSDTTTVRQTASSFLALEEIREYESFNLATNPDIACDDTATQCLIVSEGVRQKLTLTCDCEDKNSNDICDLADVVTSTLTEAPFDDGLVHIYGLSDNYLTLPVVSSVKLDSGPSAAHYPAVGFDPISKRFLATWEDFRGGANTKVYGQLIFSGGSKYNDNFIISYQDTDGDGENDPNVLNSKQTKPFVSYDSINQRFFVIWQDGRNSVLSNENLDIYGQKVDSEGSLRGYNFAVLNQPGNQYNPTIAFNDLTNKFLAVWKDARNAQKNNCSATGGSGTGSKPCGSDVYDQIFALDKPSLTLLKMDSTPLAPPLLNDFQNPPDSGSVAVGRFATQSFKVVNTGDATLKIDYVNKNTCNGSPIAPFSFDGLPAELEADDGITLDFVPGASLTLTVRFTPLSAGSYNKCFTIQSNGGNPTVSISALGIEANITVVPESWDFGDVFIGKFADKSFEVRNSGLATLDIYSIDPPSTPFTIQTDGCSGKSVASGDSCNIVARFTPTALGVAPGTSFVIHSNDTNEGAKTVTLSGTGRGAPSITVNPPSIDFGNVQVNQNSLQTLTIRNDGIKDLRIKSITTLLTPFGFANNGCKNTTGDAYPFILAPTESCQVVLKFSPTTTGSTSASVTIVSNDPIKPSVAVDLKGQGVATPELKAAPSSLNFPATIVDQSSQKTIIVSNVGYSDLVITGFVNPSGDFAITGSNCVKTLHPKSSGQVPYQCNVKVAFTPTKTGFQVGSFGITSNDPVNPTTTIPMTGTGNVPLPPAISASPSSLNFPETQLGSTSKKVVTVSNAGPGVLNISGLVDPGDAAFIISASTCGGALAAGATCKITVAFTPVTAEAVTSSFGITSDDPVNPTLTIALSGQGVATPVISATPSSANFGGIPAGGKKSITITISNTGDADLVITTVSAPSLPFSRTADTCAGKTLVAGTDTCQITVTFAPTAVKTYTGSIAVRSSNAATLTISLRGNGLPAPAIKVTPASWDFGAVTLGARSAAKTFTVKNIGAAGSILKFGKINTTSPFKIVNNTCTGQTLTQGETCVVKIVFIPTMAVRYSPYNLTINSNDPVNPASHTTLSGTGVF